MNQQQKKLLKQLAQIGEIILIQEGNKRIKLNEKGEVSLKSHFEAIVYFFQRLDTNMLALILEDSCTYQDYDKKTFLKKLSLVFEELTSKGNTFLNVYQGKCNSSVCTNINCTGFSFLGNMTNDYMDLILEVEDGRVIDIYECHDFKMEDDTIQKNYKMTFED